MRRIMWPWKVPDSSIVEEAPTGNKILCINPGLGKNSTMSEEVNLDWKKASSRITHHVELSHNSPLIAIKNEFCCQPQGGE